MAPTLLTFVRMLKEEPGSGRADGERSERIIHAGAGRPEPLQLAEPQRGAHAVVRTLQGNEFYFTYSFSRTRD